MTTLFPRATPHSILCLLLASCVAWPVPFFERPMIEVGSMAAGRVERGSSHATFPRVLARTFDGDRLQVFARSAHEFDDVEDPDDLVTLKRFQLGSCDWSFGLSWKPIASSMVVACWVALNPSPTLPRILSLRC